MNYDNVMYAWSGFCAIGFLLTALYIFLYPKLDKWYDEHRIIAKYSWNEFSDNTPKYNLISLIAWVILYIMGWGATWLYLG